MDLEFYRDVPPWDWPADMGERLLPILRNNLTSESERLLAVEMAGDFTVINDDLSEALLEIVSGPKETPQLRARAAIAFGPALEQAYVDEFDDPESVPISESMFDRIRDTLQRLYQDRTIPKEVRRRILEASVRAPETWHEDAIRTAYASRDREWILTAVFAMRYVRGFDKQILESLRNPDPEIQREAVSGAGNWELAAAWPHVSGLINNPATPKPLLLEAIEAAGTIRPAEARDTLQDLADSPDEEIAEAAEEAIMMAEATLDDEDEEEDEGDRVN